MPLIATDIKPVLHTDRNPPSVGVWMQNENGAAVRVFVTCEALWQSKPSQVRDAHSAFETFDTDRERLEDLASDRYDESGPDDGEYEGMPVIVLRADDILTGQ
jgi:hypothetical protein